MQYLLMQNYENKISRWCLNPSDGALHVDWAIPVEDNEKITVAQFKRMFGNLLASLRESYAPINRILKTGNPDAPKSRDELIKEILLKLTDLQQYDLIPNVVAITDLERLSRILIWLNSGDFNNVKAEISRL